MREAIIHMFARHPVAPNLLMLLMLLAGWAGLSKMNTQFFPTFSVDYVNARVVWPGASAEDVETAITNVIEAELSDLDDVKKITSISTTGFSSIFVEYQQGSDLGKALDEVTEAIARVRDLPEDAEQPQIRLLEQKENVARVLIVGPQDPNELRRLTKRFERELLDRGVTRVEITGLPEEEIAIQVPSERLVETGLSLPAIAREVSARSVDLPAGEVGSGDIGRQLRSSGKKRDVPAFEDIRLNSRDGVSSYRLGDLADIERRPKRNQITLRHQGKLATQLDLFRAHNENTLEAAQILRDWVADTETTLPEGVELIVYEEQWTLLQDRINLMIKNGAGGLVLIIIILYLFLNSRVAFWVTVGIPVSFMATLGVMWMLGGTINMVSLFALIMALGIIVDDAIVVGEDALAHYQMGENSLQAAEGGAVRMLAPVMSSSLTTIAAFIPLMQIGGIMGAILFTIPLVIICVVIASVFESFLILPGHLRHSFLKMQHRPVTGFRQRLENAFDRFRDGFFRPLIRRALNAKPVVIALTLTLLMLVVGLAMGKRLAFNFFPTPESPVLIANITFVAGTPEERVQEFLAEVSNAMYQADEALGGGLIHAAVTEQGRILVGDGNFTRTGDRFALVRCELIPADARTVRNREFQSKWQDNIHLSPGVESLSIYTPQGGPPGRDIEVSLSGENIDSLKDAAEELKAKLRSIQGVTAISDNTPFGREQLIYELTPQGEALGLSERDIGSQLRAAYDGQIAQLFTELGDEIEVRVTLPDSERRSLASLESLPIILPSGDAVPLPSLVSLRLNRGFEALRHTDGKLAVKVSADVDEALNNATEVNAQLEKDVLPVLRDHYHIETRFEGRAEDQADTLADMKLGAQIALALIYIVLAWVFGSYGWPLLVMAIIPFGLAGAIFGHWVLDLNITLLSLFGLFALSGIVVNDSIILVVFYNELRNKGMQIHEALEEAACQRLRAVMLTSLTTIAGLIPLMFETSLQAQFLIPMAVSITFGLGIATMLVLILVPTLLGIYENTAARLGRKPSGHGVDEEADGRLAEQH